jgi:dienelactone hydrolase
MTTTNRSTLIQTGWRICACVVVMVETSGGSVMSQEYGPPDRDNPGDVMIQAHLRGEAERIHQSFADDLSSPATWQERLPRYRQEYLYMLGLWPLPERTPLNATVTGTLEGEGFTVEMLHYQSKPGLYVTANLYRPPQPGICGRLPAVLYVCGHSGRGRNGNKTAFQSHGMWFARHGYVCLMVDTLQLGEIAAIHHGTYRENRWWWHSRGYTSAGVECWNGVRGIDYLIGRPDVDPDRIAVTGISGGGAATFWVAAADERVAVAVPVSGMADLPSYVSNRVINGHCDCMFLYNTFQWPWTRIAALLAPRPQLFVNSDQDRIFPMDANDRVITQLERLYSLHGAGDRVDAVVSIGGHDYRQDIRQATYRFINAHLQGDPRPVSDSEVDLVTDGRDPVHPIPPEKLRVFPTDADLPADELNTTIDEHFVPVADVKLPAAGQFDSWKRDLLAELRRVSFRPLPERVAPARKTGDVDAVTEQVETEPGIEIRLRYAAETFPRGGRRVLLVVAGEDEAGRVPEWTARVADGAAVVVCEPRGIGATRWTQKNPPNYVARSHVLLGRTVDVGRVWDVAAAVRYVREHSRIAGAGTDASVQVAGRGPAGVIGAYAALLEPDVAGVTLLEPPLTHGDASAPQFLNVLRVCDVPDALGMLAPRLLTIMAEEDARLERVAALYAAAGAAERVSRRGR